MNLEDKKGDGAINDKGRSGGKKLTNLAWKGEEGGRERYASGHNNFSRDFKTVNFLPF